jgi:hypothetical protein
VRGSRVAQSVQCLATDWTTGRSRFDPRQGQRIFPLASVSRPALGPTQPPVQWVPGVLSPGVKCCRGVTLTTHSHLVPKSWMSRSYTSSLPSASMTCSGTALLYFTMVVRSWTRSEVGLRIIWFVMQLELYNGDVDCVSVTELKARVLRCCGFDLVSVSADWYSVVSCEARSVPATRAPPIIQDKICLLVSNYLAWTFIVVIHPHAVLISQF